MRRRRGAVVEIYHHQVPRRDAVMNAAASLQGGIYMYVRAWISEERTTPPMHARGDADHVLYLVGRKG